MRPLSVMVADDEPGIREMIRDALTRYGHSVVCAENGVRATELLSTNPVDLLFLDIRMPGGDGLTALKQISKLRPSLPVVVITGSGQRELIDKSLEMGSFACLAKPFSVTDIIGILEVVASDDLDVGGLVVNKSTRL